MFKYFGQVWAPCDCAIALQKLMAERNAGTPEAKRVVYRVGVNLGDVLVEGDDILGDGVNIAARLEALCEPGGVLISGAAYDHVRGRIEADFADLGEKDLKNIARTVRVYSVKTGPMANTPAPAAPKRDRRQAHPLPHRRQPRRRAHRGRRHLGRRSERRGAARRDLRAGGRLRLGLGP